MNEEAQEAMADPESVTVVVKGRNGYEVRVAIKGAERTKLDYEMSVDQDRPDVEYWQIAPPPAWKRFTFTVTQRPSYRAEDFLPLLGGDTPSHLP